MGDERSALPHVHENKLLQSLSETVRASAASKSRVIGSHGKPYEADGSLENRLLKNLSLRSSLATKTTSALPLKSSVLSKYEAEHQPLPKKPRPYVASGCFDLFRFAGPDRSELERTWSSEGEDKDEDLDSYEDLEFMSEECPVRAPPVARKKKRTEEREKNATFGRTAFGFCAPPGGLFGSSDESWALPESQYDFKGVDLAHEFDDQLVWRSPEEAGLPDREQTRKAKLDFLTTVCVSLGSQVDFKIKEDSTRQRLIKLGQAVAQHVPEFILKVALYARQELYLRSTANFLLSLAAYLESCRPFLKKYYAAAVRLPTDWIEVAEQYQLFDDSKLNFGSLPAALRKVMVDKFSEFDSYQLAKYNKTKKSIRAEPVCEDAEPEEQRQRRFFTIKTLVRLLHIRRPVEPVMAIVGKKYPADPDAFRRSGLPGTFDSTRCNQRMKLPVPETWETQVAMHGNKAEVWQQLIDHKKLPYMAMLRNLRNLILANIGCAHHDKVLKSLTNESAVLNSRQMVFRYLSAYAALDELERLMEDTLAEQQLETPRKADRKRSGSTKKSVKEIWIERKKRALLAKKRKVKYNVHVIQQYRSALDRAVEIATIHNVPPIAGRSLIFCDVSYDRMSAVCASARGMGKAKTARTMAILLSLMCQRSSESCELLTFGSGELRSVDIERRQNLLKQADRLEENLTFASVPYRARRSRSARGPDPGTASDSSESDSGSQPSSDDWAEDDEQRAPDDVETKLDQCLHDRQWVDNVVVMGSGAHSWHLNRTLELYRQLVNPNLLFVSVDLVNRDDMGDSYLKSDPRNVLLFGFSDQTLRFVADRGITGQLAAVEAIDVKYNLRRDIRLPAINLREAILASEGGFGVARWRTVRVFVSSTFLDMHGERDLLIRHVLPELRGRTRALRLDLQVVDLRWGITAEDAEKARQIELCLSEIDRCQLFVGLLGARFGQTPDDRGVTDQRLLEFVRAQPAGLSLTALEMLYATRQPERARQTAVFYQRDDSFLSTVPGHLMAQFSDLAPGRRRVAELKAALQSRGCVITSYTAQFGQLSQGRSGAVGLQTFGESVMESLWNTMKTLYPLEAATCDLVTEEYTLQHEFALTQKLVGRKSRLARVVEEVERGQGRVVMVSGKPGSGKTCFMGSAYSQLSESSDHVTRLLVPAFCGAGAQCDSSTGLLAYLRALLARQPLTPAPRRQLAAELAELLAVRGRRQHVVLVLDGLDALWQLEGEAAADWLPEQVPKNVTVLISADEGGALYRRLNSLPRVVTVALGSLDLSERSGLVREMLQLYSKVLEEKAWNNQLRTLTSKRGAGDPLYLRLACEELRIFGEFDQLSAKLSSLGQTVSALTQNIIARLEESFDSQLVRLCFSALAISKHGLTEDDVFEFVKERSRSWLAQPLAQFTFTSLLRSGGCLLQRSSAPDQPALVRVPHAEMVRVIRSRYLSKQQGSLHVHELAAWLAEFFERRSGLFDEQFSWQVPPSMLQALAYFWGLAEDVDEYRRVVCSLRYLIMKAQGGLAGELLSDVRAAELADSAAQRRHLDHPHVREVVEFVSHNLHLFYRSPGLVLQQALNEPADSWLRGQAEELVGANQPAGTALLRLTRPLRASVLEPLPCRMTLRPGQAVTAATADHDEQHLFVGLASGEIKLYDVGSGREIRCFVGHGEPITGMALFSRGVHLASGSADGQLSVWQVVSGQRRAVTSAHRRRVAALAVQPADDQFASVGWSCDIKLWRFRALSGVSALGGGGGGGGGGELQELRVLHRGSQPLTCAAFHPSRQLLSTGGWDGKIKIWDTNDMQRRAVRHGHETSVRCLAISPDANYMVSGDSDGHLIIWGTQHGDAIQRSRVHQGPIQAVCYLSPDRFVTAGADGDVKLWRAHVGSEVRRVPSDSAVMLALATPSGDLLTVSGGGEVTLYAETGATRRWSRRLENVTAAATDGRRLYLTTGRSLHVLRPPDGRSERQIATDSPVTSLACLPQGAEDSHLGVAMIGLEDGRVGVVLADRGDLATTVAHAGEVTCLAVTDCEQTPPRLASGGRDGVVLLWSAEDSWRTPTLSLEAYAVPVSALAWLGDRLLTAGRDSKMYAYSSEDNYSNPLPLTGNDAPACSMAASEAYVLSTTASGQVLLWTSRLVAVTEQRCRPGSTPHLSRLPSGQLVGLLPQEHATLVVDLQKMGFVAGFGDHTAGVSSVVATKNNLLSASLDGSVKLWLTEQTTASSTDAAFLAVKHLWTEEDRVTCYFATVSRKGHVTVWKLSSAEGGLPTALYTVDVCHEYELPADLTAAAVGEVRRDPAGTLSFRAGCLSSGTLCAVRVTVSPAAAAAASHAGLARRLPANMAPAVCMAVGDQHSSVLVGDADGRLAVFTDELECHAFYECGAAPDPALMMIRVLDDSKVITCDRNAMLCRLEQTKRLNVINVSWQPILPAAASAPTAASCQLPSDASRRSVAPPPRDSRAETAQPTPPSALDVTCDAFVLGDSSGQLWSVAFANRSSVKAHCGQVTWVGRDPCRPDVLYSSGTDRRMVVWRQRGANTDNCGLQQVGEFEFATCIRHCLLLTPPSAGLPTTMVCGDDRGRLHCLQADLSRLPGTGGQQQ